MLFNIIISPYVFLLPRNKTSSKHKFDMAHLSEKHRIELLMIYGFGDRRRTQNEVCNVFNALYPDTPVSQGTVSQLIKKFRETGSIKNVQKSGRPKSATNEDKALDVILTVEETPRVSIREIAEHSGISHSSVQRILKTEKLRPYKLCLIHELNEDDFDRRAEFCELMMERCNADENFASNIIFSDEATFMLNGTVNRHNCRYWSRISPHLVEEGHTQYPQKVNVWAGIIGGHIIGPFFLEETLNADRYLRLLQNRVIPSVAALFPGENGGIDNRVFFQQDGAPPHFAADVREYISNVFPNRWIGRRGPIEWPARSPDLTPLDFFLWGHIKNKVYQERPRNLDDLKVRITAEMRGIPVEVLHRVTRNFQDRLGHCLAVNGRQFEHVI